MYATAGAALSWLSAIGVEGAVYAAYCWAPVGACAPKIDPQQGPDFGRVLPLFRAPILILSKHLAKEYAKCVLKLAIYLRE